MSCNTCNNCGSTSPCGCKDHGLTTPCGYTDCGPGNERCEEVVCAGCVSYCGTSFQIDTQTGLFQIQQGERLDMILQKMTLMIVNGFGICNANDVHHAPYNIYAQNITNTSLDVVWGGVSTLSVSLEVQIDTVITPGGWTAVNTTPISPILVTYPIANLTPNTEYKIKIVSTDNVNGTCDSVEILIKTLV